MKHKKVKKHFDNILKSKSLNSGLIFLIIYGIASLTPASAAEPDQLATVMDSVRNNFGVESAFIKILYAAEIIAGGYAWHKTKHPSAVIGIVILALFMTFALKRWIY
ncbi:MAG: hypothetical protein KKE11_06145 [Gammaproteobacteria bacterium]|nr:hypothetical protein [Gammaproteobacteria bacterium]